MSGLYIHVPYCHSKCSYCDFTSYASAHNYSDYISAVIRELKLQQEKIAVLKPSTIFMGGGTPTILPTDLIAELFFELSRIYNLRNIVECTIEANPKTLTLENLIAYKKIGFNRISIGVQSLQSEILNSISRAHNPTEAIEAITLAKVAGFENISVDLLYGLPSQKKGHVLNDINRLISEGVKHISFYGLQVEENTPIQNKIEKGLLHLPNEKEVISQYLEGANLLESKGYKQYEISNFSKKNYKCLHNLGYWDGSDYLGLGVSSHSKKGNKRFYNTEKISKYLKNIQEGFIAVEKVYALAEHEEKLERLMLSMRTNEGVPLSNMVYSNAAKKYIENLVSNNMAQTVEGKLILTPKGYLLSNKIISDMWDFIEF
ncbi:radical SAM family heme chaperone HemW [Proteinivorax tanatarense]|uniref:Heme chaperone HemW n=1 Tax=Proteinivorax tanatarense TaxID=1260629 RepID=A0AAU7VI34_9FIRM